MISSISKEAPTAEHNGVSSVEVFQQIFTSIFNAGLRPGREYPQDIMIYLTKEFSK